MPSLVHIVPRKKFTLKGHPTPQAQAWDTEVQQRQTLLPAEVQSHKYFPALVTTFILYILLISFLFSLPNSNINALHHFVNSLWLTGSRRLNTIETDEATNEMNTLAMRYFNKKKSSSDTPTNSRYASLEQWLIPFRFSYNSCKRYWKNNGKAP